MSGPELLLAPLPPAPVPAEPPMFSVVPPPLTPAPPLPPPAPDEYPLMALPQPGKQTAPTRSAMPKDRRAIHNLTRDHTLMNRTRNDEPANTHVCEARDAAALAGRVCDPSPVGPSFHCLPQGPETSD